MQRESWKVFLACAIGAGLGSLVALEVHQYFWWVGLIVGGLTGYLSYEWRAVLRAIPAAYRAARGWQPPQGYWKALGWYALVMVTTLFYLGGVVALTVIYPQKPPTWVVVVTVLLALDTLLYLSLLFNFTHELGIRRTGKGYRLDGMISDMKAWLFYTSPPTLLFWHLPRGLVWIVRNVPNLARFLRRFGWQLFLRIHSEERLLCGVDAMLGAAVGYLTGSALIGATAGGIFGVVNYAVVTERWLKRRGYLPIRS